MCLSVCASVFWGWVHSVALPLPLAVLSGVNGRNDEVFHARVRAHLFSFCQEPGETAATIKTLPTLSLLSPPPLLILTQIYCLID